ncbi:MAG: flagellar hook protein FlgE [Wolinella sp.]
MLRSMWSGVSGMQAHQVALDVEGHNIANVNTVGFKYSRANFADMLSQVNRISTSPYGGLGGQNDYSVGLGTTINSTTKVFSQGSVKTTENKTDLAIGGDGFFVVSGNNGRTNSYTRDGAFNFDAVGNLVNNTGHIVQGWLRNLNTCDECCTDENLHNVIDTTTPITGIKIKPKMVIPAKATSQVQLTAKLTAGDTTKSMDCAHALDSTSATASDGLVARYDSSGRKMQHADDIGAMFNSEGNAYRLSEGQGIWVSYEVATVSKPVPVGVQSEIVINGTRIAFSNDSTTSGISSLLAAQNAINAKKGITGVEAFVDGANLRLSNDNSLDGDASKKNIIITGTGTGALANFSNADNVITAFRYSYTSASNADSASAQFRTTEDLRALIQQDANYIKRSSGNPAIARTYVEGDGQTLANASVKVTVNKGGMFEILNQDDGVNPATPKNLNITVTSYYDKNVTSNVLFKESMRGLNTGILVEGGTSSTSGALMAAKHAATTDIIDSLGNKHTFTVEFRKISGQEWSFKLKVPEPSSFINGSAERPNILEGGRVTFGEGGAIIGMTPNTVQFDPATGAKSPQRISLQFGASGTFTGITSTSEDSSTGHIGNNGYQSGTLGEMRFDANGVLMGKFSNGRDLALAQVAVASFVNNAGLQAEGSNLYSRTSNSGEPAIGTANKDGRGSIHASSLEASNVDLSRSLTELIIVQRGFQANSKTITTSDQILNTLIQLKQ